VRQGASWTAASHLQPAVTAVAGPVRAAWCPRSPCCCAVLGCCSLRRRLPGGASSRPPAVRHRRPGRHCPDARHGVGRRSVSSIGVYPSGVVRVSSRPGVQPSGVRSPGFVVWVSGGPVVCCPPVQRPAGWCPPRRSGRVRLLRYQTVALAQVDAAGTRHHRNGASPGGLPRRRAARSMAEGPDAGDAARSCVGQ
jgi:hypothetical protein